MHGVLIRTHETPQVECPSSAPAVPALPSSHIQAGRDAAATAVIPVSLPVCICCFSAAYSCRQGQRQCLSGAAGPNAKLLKLTCSLESWDEAGVKLRAQGAGQAAMRKGLGRGAFICGVRRSLDPSTSVEALLVAGMPRPDCLVYVWVGCVDWQACWLVVSRSVTGSNWH